MDAILATNQLKKQFGGLTAVNNLDFFVERNKINALIGPNGSGKTTTLNMISGALCPTSGEILLDGVHMEGQKEFRVARQGIRRTFQNLKLFWRLTAKENVMMGGEGSDESIVRYIFAPGRTMRMERELAEKAMEKLAFVGLQDMGDKLVSDIPYGQQKLIEIARALMGEPKLLLLDEPATGLNPTERAALVELLLKIKASGITILIIEHNMDVIMRISDCITAINFGTKIAKGTPEEIQNNQAVIEAYLGANYQKIDTGKEAR